MSAVGLTTTLHTGEDIPLPDLEVLGDAELVALFFRAGAPRTSALTLARSILSHFGSLRGLLAADRRTQLAHRGIGLARCAALQAAIEIARRVRREPLERNSVMKDPDALHLFLTAQLRDHPYEVILGLFLDKEYRLIACEELFRGTTDHVHGHPREVVRRALEREASAVVTARNQPDGEPSFTLLDRHFAERLSAALVYADSTLLDHIVVGEGPPVSLTDTRRDEVVAHKRNDGAWPRCLQLPLEL